MNAQLIEEKTNEFFLRGRSKQMFAKTKTVEVDGEIYSKRETYYDLVDLYKVDYDNDVLPPNLKGLFNICHITLSVAPYFNIKVHYLASSIGIQTLDDVFFIDEYCLEGNRKTHGICGSSVFEVRVLNDICDAKGIETYSSGRAYSQWADYERAIHESNQLKFFYQTREFSVYNNVYIVFRFEDVVNMNPTLFSKTNISCLKSACESYPILKNSLIPEVFERKLTDLEKLECAQKFISIASKEIGKRRINKKYNYVPCKY